MRFLAPILSLMLATFLYSVSPCVAAEATQSTVAKRFEGEIAPLLKNYCLGCHSTEKHKGDLDLERFASFEVISEHPKPWETMIEQLSLGEMPPKEKPQP